MTVCKIGRGQTNANQYGNLRCSTQDSPTNAIDIITKLNVLQWYYTINT